MKVKKTPYGISDFVDIATNNYYYVDKTKHIENVENSSNFLFFIRPRRFGKSLFLNTLIEYYDISQKDQFEKIFGNLYIGKHPTEERNKYLILKFNFSQIDCDNPQKSFEAHCNTRFRDFADAYQKYFDVDIMERLSERDDANGKLDVLANLASRQGLPIYLFIDEIQEMIAYYKSVGLIKVDTQEHIETMKQWYNNYCFSKDCIDEKVFNTDMILYFMKYFIEYNKAPEVLVDTNVRIDYGKLRHLIILDQKLNGNFSKIKEIAENGEVSTVINNSFPVEGLAQSDNFVSLLFYFGIISIDRVEHGEIVLRVPNLTTQSLLFSYIVQGYKDGNVFNIKPDILQKLASEMAYKNNWRGIFDFISEQIKEQLSVRDFIEGEKAIQTFHAAYISMSNYFVIKTKQERNFGFADLILEPNLVSFPDMKYKYIVEFKYINHSVKKESKEFTTQLETKRNDTISQLRKYSQDGKYNSTSIKDTTELNLVYIIYYGWEMIECEIIM